MNLNKMFTKTLAFIFWKGGDGVGDLRNGFVESGTDSTRQGVIYGQFWLQDCA